MKSKSTKLLERNIVKALDASGCSYQIKITVLARILAFGISYYANDGKMEGLLAIAIRVMIEEAERADLLLEPQRLFKTITANLGEAEARAIFARVVQEHLISTSDNVVNFPKAQD